MHEKIIRFFTGNLELGRRHFLKLRRVGDLRLGRSGGGPLGAPLSS